jgi:CheY-like chemotaxis protein
MARVLVVDDDEQVCRLLRVVLEKNGHEVQDAPDGARAEALCRECPPDVIIMDLVMPNKEGIETIRDLQRDCPWIPIIAISGGGCGSAQTYLTLAERLGARCGLAKPFGAGELLNAVDQALAAPVSAAAGTPPPLPPASAR